MDKEHKVRQKIGITCGDVAGIGPETIVRLVADNRMLHEAILIFYCPLFLINKWKKTLGVEDVQVMTIQNASSAQLGKFNLITPKDTPEIIEGQPSENTAKLALWALEKSAEDLANKAIDAVVTAPVSKHHLELVLPGFVGHTEFYNEKFKAEGAIMVLCSNQLKVALASNHLPIKDVSSAITKEVVLMGIKNLNTLLRKDFKIIKPRIAVLGLNPHAGESGNIGIEEMEQISPAISAAKGLNILAFGPYSADGFFGSGQCFEFDAVLAMYHDQGLTGFKALATEGGVNYTGGLSIIRTSPGHGTAFDIAGKGMASAEGLRNAVYLAIDTANNRQEHLKNNETPLAFSVQQKEYDASA